MQGLRSSILYTSLPTLCTSPIPFSCCTLTDQKPFSGVPLLMELFLYSKVLEIQSILFIFSKIQCYNGVCSDSQHQKKCCHLHITEKDLKKSCVASSTEAFHMCVHFHTVASIIEAFQLGTVV